MLASCTTILNKIRMKLIGISGTNGSGKDTVGHILADQYNLLFVSVSDLLREEARKRGLPIMREVLRTISAEWRRDFGLGVLVDRSLVLLSNEKDRYAGVITSSMRNSGEAQHLKDIGGKLIWVDADQRIRYERISRGNRGRSGEDDKTFDQFVAEEMAEMHTSGDETTLNHGDVKELADVVIVNNGNNLQELAAVVKLKTDRILNEL